MAEEDRTERRIQVANAWPEDAGRGLDVLRLDGLQRANAGVGSGDFVHVDKLVSRAAQRVVFAPAQNNLRLQGNPEALKRVFFQRPVTADDIIATAGQQQVPPGDMAPRCVNI